MYNTLTNIELTLNCPRNAGNPISEDLNFKCFPAEDAPGTLSREPLWTVRISNPFSKILFAPLWRVVL